MNCDVLQPSLSMPLVHFGFLCCTSWQCSDFLAAGPLCWESSSSKSSQQNLGSSQNGPCGSPALLLCILCHRGDWKLKISKPSLVSLVTERLTFVSSYKPGKSLRIEIYELCLCLTDGMGLIFLLGVKKKAWKTNLRIKPEQSAMSINTF